MLGEQRFLVSERADRYTGGYQKLQETYNVVEVLKASQQRSADS